MNHNAKVKSRYLEGTRQLCSALNVCWPRRELPARLILQHSQAAAADRGRWRQGETGGVSSPFPQGCEAGQRRWAVGWRRRGWYGEGELSGSGGGGLRRSAGGGWSEAGERIGSGGGGLSCGADGGSSGAGERYSYNTKERRQQRL